MAQPLQVLDLQYAQVRVRQEPALERALARPDHIGDEVLEAQLGEALETPGERPEDKLS